MSKTVDEVASNFHSTGCPFSKEYGSCNNSYCERKLKAKLAQIEKEARVKSYQEIADYIVYIYPDMKSKLMLSTTLLTYIDNRLAKLKED